MHAVAMNLSLPPPLMSLTAHDLIPAIGARAALIAILLSWLLPVTAAAAETQPRTKDWLLVDTHGLTLAVMRDERPQLTLHDLSIGRYGTSTEKVRGDKTTPLGRFRITRIDRRSGFHVFVQLDYPDIERARKAQLAGDISRRELQTIVSAHRLGKAPPQNTVLGGEIGIHGLGEADPVVHQMMNWTRGCVAITDRQMDSLLGWIRVGMTVEIR